MDTTLGDVFAFERGIRGRWPHTLFMLSSKRIQRTHHQVCTCATPVDDILIARFGREAATLRGNHASVFKEEMDTLAVAAQQQIMARLTGNYKRGNEKQAKKHPRNAR